MLLVLIGVDRLLGRVDLRGLFYPAEIGFTVGLCCLLLYTRPAPKR